MGAVSYIFNDYVKDLSSADIDLVDAGGSCVDSNYPITNIQNEKISLRTWTDAKAAVKLQFDIGSTKQLQAFFIGNHNFSGGTLDINSYTANDYATGKVTVESALSVRLLDLYHYESSAPTAQRYWEFDLTNVTTADSVFKVGRVVVYDSGGLVQLTDNPDYVTNRGYGFRNIINYTTYGIHSAAHKLTEKRERFQLTWAERTAANNLDAELRTLYDDVHGDAHPFIYIPDITLTDCYYVNMENADLLYSEIHGVGADAHVGGLALRVVEAVRGKV